jgi:hypothetical protein
MFQNSYDAFYTSLTFTSFSRNNPGDTFDRVFFSSWLHLSALKGRYYKLPKAGLFFTIGTSAKYSFSYFHKMHFAFY